MADERGGNAAHEVDVDPKEPDSDPLQSAYQAAVVEERRLWRAFQDPVMKAAERLVAYARWRAAVKRMNELALKLGLPGVDSQG